MAGRVPLRAMSTAAQRSSLRYCQRCTTGSRLRYLTLDATDVGDDGLEHLRDLPALQFLSLAGTLVTDAGLEKLRDLPQLRTLYLGYTRAGLPPFYVLVAVRVGSIDTVASLAKAEGVR